MPTSGTLLGGADAQQASQVMLGRVLHIWMDGWMDCFMSQPLNMGDVWTTMDGLAQIQGAGNWQWRLNDT